MLEIMYEIPSKDNVEECVISEDVIMKKDKANRRISTKRGRNCVAKQQT
jgi:ATP-dependent protease Clp ATPase subunit